MNYGKVQLGAKDTQKRTKTLYDGEARGGTAVQLDATMRRLVRRDRNAEIPAKLSRSLLRN